MSGTRYAQFCALARAAEILGERWTLLIIRELLLGPKRFSDLTDRLGSVSPTMLTARLTALIESGVVRRALLPAFNTQVYELTGVGLGLKPVLREMIRWGGHFLFPMRRDDEFEPDWGLLALEAIARRSPAPASRIVLHIKHKDNVASFLVEGGKAGTTIAKSEGPGGAAITGGFDTLLRIIAGQLPLQRAVSGKLATVDGSMKIASMLPRLFELGEAPASS